MRNFERYCKDCKDYKNIENYDKALADNFKGWYCHHRLQTWNSDGERRLVDITADELKALDMYYNRPASELIFLTISEHSKLHNKGEHNPMYGKQGYWKDKTNPMYGKHHSEETKKRQSEAMKGKQVGENHPFYGKKHSDEAKKKMSEVHKGTRWFNNGKICIRAKECPDGFTPGRLLI